MNDASEYQIYFCKIYPVAYAMLISPPKYVILAALKELKRSYLTYFILIVLV